MLSRLSRTPVSAVGVRLFPRGVQPVYSSIPATYRSYATKASAKPKPKFFQRVKNGVRFVLSSAIVMAALGVTSVSMYLVFKELFSPTGQTPTFNRVVSRVEKNPQCLRLLGYSDSEIAKGGIKLKAYGDVPQDRWTRDRPIRATQYTAKDGTEHMLMRFFVESKYKVGVVRVEAVDQNLAQQSLQYLTLDVEGQQRYYLVGHPPHQASYAKPLSLFGNGSFLGVKWGKDKDSKSDEEKK